METPGKNTAISFVYKDQEYEIYYIPQDFGELVDEVWGRYNIETSIKMHYLDFDNDKVSMKNNEQYQNALKYWDKNGIFLLKIFVKENSFNMSDEESVAEEEVHANKVPEK